MEKGAGPGVVKVRGGGGEGGEGRGAAFPRADGAVGRRCRYRRRLSELARRLWRRRPRRFAGLTTGGGCGGAAAGTC